MCWSPLFADLGDEIDASIAHLVGNGWLAAVGDYLVVGPAAQDRFGGARFVDLLATFEGSAGATVVDTTGNRIGTLDWGQVADNSGDPRPDPIVLGGTGWLILTVDRAAGTVTVTPSSEGRAPSWRGPTQEVGRATWEAAREILASTDVPVSVDDRANVWLENLREEWASRLDDPVREDTKGMVVDAFAGAAVHQAVLRALALEGSVDGPTCRISAPLSTGATAAHVALDQWDRIVQAEAAQQSTKLSVRHHELLAPAVLAAEAFDFHVDRDGIRKTLEMIAGRC